MGFGLHPEQEVVVRDTNRLDADNVLLGNDQDMGFCRGFDVIEGNDLVVLNASGDESVSIRFFFVSPQRLHPSRRHDPPSAQLSRVFRLNQTPKENYYTQNHASVSK